MSRRSGTDDAGSAVVGFVLVSLLTTVVFLGVLQVALALHVRATLVDCAAEGARYGALADRTPADGAARARELVAASLSPRFAEQVEGSRAVLGGLDVVRVEIVAPLPVLGLLGPGGVVEVDGHALAEAP
ncbi:pilus assembly protein TadE [Actinotalea ferrariae CF5-4]|uniref:Pilus assembly protein TadE n=1 Tax=Actinotalea ferrariae CF5-4 TaxID=948458 RepID=A0A021VQ70_9CELL|nr:TadE family protein [Actinotalea ferrariae]EYR63258.1 pilus assembly protein TadE [Actinotalea ferrariae CF5-4]